MLAALPPQLSMVAMAGVAAFICWRLYHRVRSAVGRQAYVASRSWSGVVVFPLIACLLLVGAWSKPPLLAVEAAGLCFGALLSFWGLRLTRFESSASGFFYTPNPYMGVALTALLFCGIGYRILMVRALVVQQDISPLSVVIAPVPLAVIGTMAGYYSCFAAGIILRHRRHRLQYG